MNPGDIYIRRLSDFNYQYKVRIIKILNGIVAFKLADYNDNMGEVSESAFNSSYEFSEKLTEEYLIKDIIE